MTRVLHPDAANTRDVVAPSSSVTSGLLKSAKSWEVMFEGVDTRAEWADQKVVERGVAVVVVVQPHHTQSAVDVQCRNAMSAPGVLDGDSWNGVEPSRVVVKRRRVEVEDGLRSVKAERESELWGQGVVANIQVGGGLKRPRSRAL